MGPASVARVVGLSAILMMGSYLLSVTDFFHAAVYERHLPWIADGTAWLLGLLQLDAAAAGQDVVSDGVSVRIAPGCDAILPSAMLASLIVPFPAPWRWKLAGVLLGTALLVLLNFVRTASLVLVGVHYPEWLETMHVDVWQSAFVILTLGLFLTWMILSSRPGLAGQDGS
jgi:exosortase/archaeosortase family protein